MIRSKLLVVATIAITGLAMAGCGGDEESSSGQQVTAEDRIAGCLEQQPDATRSDCEQWEEDGQLADDGTHAGHESM